MAMLEGDMYCDFQRDMDIADRIAYRTWRISTFRDNHKKGDRVMAHVTYISSKMCIAWCEGIAATIENYKGKGLIVGRDYEVSVSFNTKGQVEFKMV